MEVVDTLLLFVALFGAGMVLGLLAEDFFNKED